MLNLPTTYLEPELVETARTMACRVLEVMHEVKAQRRTQTGHVEHRPGEVTVWCMIEWLSTDGYRQWVPGEYKLTFSHGLVREAHAGRPWLAPYILSEMERTAPHSPPWIADALEDLSVLL